MRVIKDFEFRWSFWRTGYMPRLNFNNIIAFGRARDTNPCATLQYHPTQYKG